MILVFDYQ